MEIKKEDICNLSKLPYNIDVNPCYKTVLEIVKNKNIKYNETTLYKHYNKLKTFYDLFEIEKMKSLSIHNIFLPWIHNKPVTQFTDKAFISNNDEGIKKQFNKLKQLTLSINEKGFRPQDYPDRKGGNVTGYFLVDNTQKKFYIVSGNHRTAVLFALFPEQEYHFGFEKYSFMKERDKVHNGVLNFKEHPYEFNINDVNKWPSVTSGFLTENEAKFIFKRYME